MPTEKIKSHWPEYLMEAGGLGLFMVSACVFGVLIEHPASSVRQAVDSAVARRALMGLAMGLTAVGIIYSPWGKQSGAHLNPAVTLTFHRLGKIDGWDAFFYVLFQFAGGAAGALLAAAALGPPLAHSAVNYVVTVPGDGGPLTAFWAELLISFVLMATVLLASNSPRFSRFTGAFAGALLAVYITFEAPLSGMSINPARTAGSAWPARVWTDAWIYFVAPPAAMLLAGELYRLTHGARAVHCAKLNHHNNKRCIFRCNFGAIEQPRS